MEPSNSSDPSSQNCRALNDALPDQITPALEDRPALRTRLLSAIYNDDKAEVEEMVKEDKEILNYPLPYEKGTQRILVTPLVLATFLVRNSVKEFLTSYYKSWIKAQIEDPETDINAPLGGDGMTLLHTAADSGWLDVVDLLLSRNAIVDKPATMGWTALHSASMCGHIDVIHRLVEAGANLEQRTDAKQTPFLLACTNGSSRVLQTLWDLGSQNQIHYKDENCDQALHTAARNDNMSAIIWLLRKGADIEAAGHSGATPLLLACLNQSHKAAEILLFKGANIHANDNREMLTPMLVVCRNLDRQLLSLCMRYGASLLDQDKEGCNCFHQATVSQKSLEDFKLITNLLVGYGVNINHESHHDLSPLAQTCSQGQADRARWLIFLGADINQAGSHTGTTALMFACTRPQNTATIDLLLDHNADTTKSNRHGNTALAIACSFGNSDNALALVSRGCVVPQPNNFGITPLGHSMIGGHVNLGIQLLKGQAYFPTNPENQMPFIETKRSAVDIEYGLLSTLRSGRVPSEDLHPIMFWAVTNGCVELAQECINHDTAVAQMKRGYVTLLHMAAKHGQSKVVPLLAEAGVSEVDSGKLTAMHLAAARGIPETVEELLKLANKTATTRPQRERVRLITRLNAWENTSLAVAVMNKQREVLNLFLREIKTLSAVEHNFLSTDPDEALNILEMVAQLEKPGHEETLKCLLQQWCPQPTSDSSVSVSALELAVQCSQATVVWWLLSNGAYQSNHDKIVEKYGLEQSSPDSMKGRIKKLLEKPPPILRRVANPNDDKPPKLPQYSESSEHSLNGSIVDFLFDGTVVDRRFSIKEIIYDQGPNSLMKNQKRHPRQQFYDFKSQLTGQSTHVVRNETTGDGKNSDQIRDDQAGGDQTGGNMLYRWIHLPFAEMHLMRDLASRIAHDSGVSEMSHNSKMRHFNSSWTELAAGGNKRYMKPQCNYGYLPDGRQGQWQPNQIISLYMPFLSFGKHTMTDDPSLSSMHDTFEGIDETIQSRKLRRVTHKRMTLDQYYYSVLSSTEKRDADQVLSKFLKRHHYQATQVEDNRSPLRQKECRILVVDQLWIWVVDEKTIITATTEERTETGRPDTEETNSPSFLLFDTLKKNLIGDENESRFQRPTSIPMFLELVLGITTGFFERPVERPKTTLDVFRDSIRHVIDTETQLFNDFHKSLKDESKSRERQTDDSVGPGHAIQFIPKNPYHVIDSETTLLNEIRDIRDELRILSSLADDQDEVWKQALCAYARNNPLQYHHPSTPSDVKRNLKSLVSEAETAHDSINLLLDLRQKQASIKEAEFGRIQANDSARQSNSILIFTIITIIFLPLSFLASLFALDVSTFPHESGDLKYQGVWLFPILFGVTAVVSIPTIILAWKINAVSDWWNGQSSQDRWQPNRPRHFETESETREVERKVYPLGYAMGFRRRKTPLSSGPA